MKFEVIAGNATASVDYYYTSNNVLLSDGETMKQVHHNKNNLHYLLYGWLVILLYGFSLIHSANSLFMGYNQALVVICGDINLVSRR